ncbi:hypothetical protein ACH474_09975 [Nocardia rhamnosiphila]|uniref:hypothetical protein n=1 Tax=Nocardia rhamnosiphila TaxID=426716 RepID=UPI0037A1FD59
MSGVAWRSNVAAAAIVSIAFVPACGADSSHNTAPTESSHTIRDQCDRTLTFFENDLGIDDLAIEYGSNDPDAEIGRGATCTLTKASVVGVGETRLRATLPNESEPALVKGDPNYIAQNGYDEKVWVNQSDGSVRIVTTADGWQGTLNLNSDQVNNVGEEPKLDLSDHDVRAASEFLIDLTRELTS